MVTEITVITPTIPGREHLLQEAIASVDQQTIRPTYHFIYVDTDQDGPAITRNRMLADVETEWVAFLDDDDLLDRHHLDILGSGHADVRASYCRFTSDQFPYRIPAKYINRRYDRETMRRHGIFGITVLARTDQIRQAGCFDPADRWEDWSLWNRMADDGATFEVIPIVTWTYRLGHGNRTHA